MQEIEDIYQHKQISQRVYVKAKLLLHGVQTEMSARRSQHYTTEEHL